ncbi:MAG: hypothetical protein AAGF74_12255 [Pseudomonadota bacterium]
MKRIALTAAAALLVAAPAFAQSQLERSLGVEPGVYSLAELVELKDKSTFEGNDGALYLGDDLVTRGFSVDFGLEGAFAHAAEQDDGAERNRQFGLNTDPTGEVAARVRANVADTITGNF